MPEVFPCPYCHKKVNLDEDEYVVLDKYDEFTRAARLKTDWRYAHYSCYEQEMRKRGNEAAY